MLNLKKRVLPIFILVGFSPLQLYSPLHLLRLFAKSKHKSVFILKAELLWQTCVTRSYKLLFLERKILQDWGILSKQKKLLECLCAYRRGLLRSFSESTNRHDELWGAWGVWTICLSQVKAEKRLTGKKKANLSLSSIAIFKFRIGLPRPPRGKQHLRIVVVWYIDARSILRGDLKEEYNFLFISDMLDSCLLFQINCHRAERKTTHLRLTANLEVCYGSMQPSGWGGLISKMLHRDRSG